MPSVTRTVATLLCLLAASAAASHAQTRSAPPPQPADGSQRLVVGTKGAVTLGIAGYLDRFASSEDQFPTHLTLQFDIGKFVTRSFVVRGGVVGSSSFGGDGSDELPDGPGAQAMHGLAGLHFYLTPDSIASVYVGGEYWAQLTRRREPDAGSVLGRVGVQGAVSSRIGVFLEAGYGIGLTRGDEGERLSRFIAQVGFRLRL